MSPLLCKEARSLGGKRKGPSFMVSDQRNLKGHHDNGNFSDKCSLEKIRTERETERERVCLGCKI